MEVVHSQQLPWTEALDHSQFKGRRKALGGDKLSCGLWELPPGKRSFPFHFHHGTEEALYVLSGKAKLRTTDGETRLGPGDFVSFPAGGPAHQIINEGSEPFVYLAISAGVGVDVVEYPDSGKIVCAVGKWPKVKRFVFDAENQADSCEGED